MIVFKHQGVNCNNSTTLGAFMQITLFFKHKKKVKYCISPKEISQSWCWSTPSHYFPCPLLSSTTNQNQRWLQKWESLRKLLNQTHLVIIYFYSHSSQQILFLDYQRFIFSLDSSNIHRKNMILLYFLLNHYLAFYGDFSEEFFFFFLFGVWLNDSIPQIA